MGTYVSISIGEFDFLTSKNSFGELLLPFSSRDLRIEDAFDEDGEQYTRRYFSSTVSRLKLILDSYGFTIEVAKQNFATLKTEKLDFIQYCLESDGETFGLSQEDVATNFTFENWYQAALRYAEVLANGQYELDQFRTENLSIAEKILLDSLPYGEGYWGFTDVEFNVWSVFRTLLDAFPSEMDVILDYTDLYESGWCDEYPTEEDYDVPKTIILTEGKFDAEVISKSIELLYPFMSKFYSFMNFSEYKVQGLSLIHILLLVEQVALEHSPIPGDETAPCVFWYLLGGAGVVENDLRKHTIRSAANTEIHVVAYLAGDDGRIRPLRGKNEMNTKCPSLPRNGGQLVFNLCQQLLPFVISSGLVQHLRHLVTGEHQPGKSLPRGLVVGVQVFALRFFQPLFAALQNRRELV